MSFTFLDPHTDNEVDGESFMDLSESDLREMIPNKLVVVKKILMLQQEVHKQVCIHTVQQ